MVAWTWLLVAAWAGYIVGYGWPEIIYRAIRKVRRRVTDDRA